MDKPLRFAAASVALFILVSCAALVSAQGPTPASPPDAFNASSDSLTVLVEYRSADEIQRDLNSAMGEQALVVQNLERAKMMETLAENRIKLKQVEIEWWLITMRKPSPASWCRSHECLYWQSQHLPGGSFRRTACGGSGRPITRGASSATDSGFLSTEWACSSA